MARNEFLEQWASAVDRAAQQGALDGKPLVIREIGVIAGPRAGALEIDAGFDAGRLLRAMSADDCALLRQFVPWRFMGEPAAYMSGRYVRFEAGWSDDLSQRDVQLSQLNGRPNGSGRWLAGINELGRAVTLGLSDHAPHWLIAGTTGSGKSVELRSMVMQLSRNGDQLVLVDGKFGDGLRGLDHLPGVMGPLAIDVETSRAALAWVVAEMIRRYEHDDRSAPRLVCVIDEVQELVSDEAIGDMIRRLTAQGRSARVHVVLATQHPTVAALGDATVKRNVSGRIALRVSDDVASRVVIGQSTPRADRLLGAGDAYAVVPGQVQRCQIAYLTKSEIERAETTTPLLTAWPAFNTELALPAGWPAGDEIGAAVLSASREEGRVKFVQKLKSDGLQGMSPERAVKLLKLGREVLDYLQQKRAFVRSVGDLDP